MFLIKFLKLTLYVAFNNNNPIKPIPGILKFLKTFSNSLKNINIDRTEKANDSDDIDINSSIINNNNENTNKFLSPSVESDSSINNLGKLRLHIFF